MIALLFNRLSTVCVCLFEYMLQSVHMCNRVLLKKFKFLKTLQCSKHFYLFISGGSEKIKNSSFSVLVFLWFSLPLATTYIRTANVCLHGIACMQGLVNSVWLE